MIQTLLLRPVRRARGLLFRGRHFSLRARLTLGVLAVLLPLYLVVLATTLHQAEERRTAETDSAVVVGQTMAAVVDGFLLDVESSVATSALALGSRERTLNQATAGGYLHAAFEQHDLLRGFFLTDLEGRVIASASGDGIDLDLSDRPYVQALLGGAETAWSDGIAGVETGRTTVAYARVVRAPDGTPRAYLVAAFYPDRLAERLPSHLSPDDAVILLDGHGRVLVQTDRPILPTEPIVLTGLPSVRSALAGQVARLESSTELSPEARYGAFVPLRHEGWVVGFTRPLAYLEQTVRSTFLQMAGGITVVTLLAAGMVALLIRRLLQPLRLLAGAVSGIAEGERPAIPSFDSEEEVTQLAQAMERMNTAVAEREDSLRFLADASGLLASSLDYEATLRSVTRLIVPQLADWCIVDLLDENGRLDRVAVAHADDTREELARQLETEYLPDLSAPDSPLARVLRTGRPVLLADIPDTLRATAAREARRLALYRLLDPTSVMIVALTAHGRTLGAITFATAESGRHYGASELRLSQDLAQRCALAVDNARLHRQLQDNLRTREDFLASVAHDLKNPLTTNKGLAQLLQRQAPKSTPEQIISIAQAIEKSATKMTALVDDLLDVARLEMGRPVDMEKQPTDVLELVRAVVAEYQASASGRRFRVDHDTSRLVGLFDQGRLARVIDNLVSNAVKYSSDEEEITISLERQDAALLIRVRDSGLGIPEEDLPRVFERFHRGRNVVERVAGTGLGLAGARRFVEAHGGTIEVESREGAGSVFTIHLPLDSPEQPEKGESDAHPALT